VGVFLLACIGLIVLGGLFVSGLRTEERLEFYIVFEESVSGLSIGSPVQYMGVPVGTVKDITVTGTDRVEVSILVSTNKVTLLQGTQATLVNYNLAAGTMAISLALAKDVTPGDPLPPGSVIPTTASLFASLSTQLGSFLEDFKEISSSITTGLKGMEEGQLVKVIEDFDATLVEGRHFIANANDTLEQVKGDIEGGVKNFNDVSVEFETLSADLHDLATNLNDLVITVKEKVEPLQLAETEEQAQVVLQNLGELTDRLKSTAQVIDTVSKSILHETENVEYMLRNVIETITETFESIRQIAQDLKEDPSALIRGRAQEE
jgi:phospholipid/cholesterol/gamma-HCH transport system substrate-binding protein